MFPELSCHPPPTNISYCSSKECPLMRVLHSRPLSAVPLPASVGLNPTHYLRLCLLLQSFPGHWDAFSESLTQVRPTQPIAACLPDISKE